MSVSRLRMNEWDTHLRKSLKLLTIVVCVVPNGKVSLKPHSVLVFSLQAAPAG